MKEPGRDRYDDRLQANIHQVRNTVCFLFRERKCDWFSTTYPGFDQRETYHVVFYADDGEDLDAQPLPVSASTGSELYLPLVVR